MTKKLSALAGIFDDRAEESPQTAISELPSESPRAAVLRRSTDTAAPATPVRRSSHPGKKPVLIHIPEDMHRALRQLSVEEGGEPLTVITERLLRQYLVERGHTRFAP